MITQKIFLQRSEQLYKDKYLYDNTIYKGMFNSVTVTCKVHGKFLVIARDFLRGTECQYCSSKTLKTVLVDKTRFFIKRAQEKHGNKFDYSKVKYVKTINKIDIICKVHGIFKQLPHAHLRGQGCPKCSNKEKQNRLNINAKSLSRKDNWILNCSENAYLYIIKCYNEQEEFIKIGISKYNDLKKRYTCYSMLPYNYELLFIKEDFPMKIWNLEKEILQKFKKYKYIPKNSFKGRYECLDTNILKTDYYGSLHQ